MPIYSRNNQYLGINAHLHSYLQHEDGGWRTFHSPHIADLSRALDAQLPSNYYARNETSLQLGIELADDFSGKDKPIRSVPDVTIVQSTLGAVAVQEEIESEIIVAVSQTFTEDDYLSSVMIHKISEGRDIPVTRIELLSPANKPPSAYSREYRLKRQQTLESGLNLVEIDYLYETRSPIPFLRSYPRKERGAYPYTLIANDPHPSVEEGHSRIFGFFADSRIPTINIPLLGTDRLRFDFGAVYNQTFSSSRFFTAHVVDCETEPLAFETYMPADQARIQARMAAVRAAHDKGVDLDSGPFAFTEKK